MEEWKETLEVTAKPIERGAADTFNVSMDFAFTMKVIDSMQQVTKNISNWHFI
jgi:hypothetical protein